MEEGEEEVAVAAVVAEAVREAQEDQRGSPLRLVSFRIKCPIKLYYLLPMYKGVGTS